jgi:hypothetical protein
MDKIFKDFGEDDVQDGETMIQHVPMALAI